MTAMGETNIPELRPLAQRNVGPRAGAIMEQAAAELTRLRAALDAATARISTLTDVIADQNDTIKSWEDEDIRCKAALDAATRRAEAAERTLAEFWRLSPAIEAAMRETDPNNYDLVHRTIVRAHELLDERAGEIIGATRDADRTGEPAP